jgi:hypothetical protein
MPNHRYWMYQVRAGSHYYFVQGGRRLAISTQAIDRELNNAVLEEWRITAGFHEVRPGVIVVIKHGGSGARGIIGLGTIKEILRRKDRWHISISIHRRATSRLLERPIPPEWVQKELKRQQRNLVDVSAGESRLLGELRKRGISIEARPIAPPQITSNGTPELAEHQIVGHIDELLSAEGKKKLLMHVVYERRQRNRALVLAHRGPPPYSCDVCGETFAAKYGRAFAGCIEVHHWKPVSAGERKPSATDLGLLCSNCHAVAHWRVREKPRTLKELKDLLRTPLKKPADGKLSPMPRRRDT